ncbi:MAG: ABC transporter ATP-binding protein, partial [Chloroflexi bacterium]|nr:ABC transporter ATP-binding protein [Chloroflexota bacterium]
MTDRQELPPEAAVAAEGTPPDDDEPILWTQNLTRRFNGTTAVADLNLSVETGSITGVVGPNGAGKTTTFLMLATLLMPTSGDAFVCGFDPVSEPRDVRRSIGYMPDFFGIYDDLRVDEYLDFFAASYGAGPSTRARL